jgi:pyruvate/2-oxoglutarate dehydrogenase complex dihydrolipoamide acyltransferase (E2) component
MSIPRLGIGMTEGILNRWLVADGDHVEAGTAIYILETDKVENEVEAVVAGIITLMGEAGESYSVGSVIARID